MEDTDIILINITNYFKVTDNIISINKLIDIIIDSKLHFDCTKMSDNVYLFSSFDLIDLGYGVQNIECVIKNVDNLEYLLERCSKMILVR